ncbi:MAG: hypothetical protein R8K20_05045 [Gallionellaceae bacterium]
MNTSKAFGFTVCLLFSFALLLVSQPVKAIQSCDGYAFFGGFGYKGHVYLVEQDKDLIFRYNMASKEVVYADASGIKGWMGSTTAWLGGDSIMLRYAGKTNFVDLKQLKITGNADFGKGLNFIGNASYWTDGVITYFDQVEYGRYNVYKLDQNLNVLSGPIDLRNALPEVYNAINAWTEKGRIIIKNSFNINGQVYILASVWPDGKIGRPYVMDTYYLVVDPKTNRVISGLKQWDKVFDQCKYWPISKMKKRKVSLTKIFDVQGSTVTVTPETQPKMADTVTPTPTNKPSANIERGAQDLKNKLRGLFGR